MKIFKQIAPLLPILVCLSQNAFAETSTGRIAMAKISAYLGSVINPNGAKLIHCSNRSSIVGFAVMDDQALKISMQNPGVQGLSFQVNAHSKVVIDEDSTEMDGSKGLMVEYSNAIRDQKWTTRLWTNSRGSELTLELFIDGAFQDSLMCFPLK